MNSEEVIGNRCASHVMEAWFLSVINLSETKNLKHKIHMALYRLKIDKITKK